jgi:hypothetical protein
MIMKQLPIILILLACTVHTYGQFGIGVEPGHASSEIEIQSTQRGMLIPRLTDAQMSVLGTGAGAAEQSLMVYNTTQKRFYYWDGSAWRQLGGICNEITDEDGDTRIEVEKTDDEDKIRITAAGSEKLVADNTGVEIKNGSLHLTSGTIEFGSPAYALPATDGNPGDVLSINSSGAMAWRNPASALGLVVGIQTSSFTNVDQATDVISQTYYVRVMPWSNIVVTKMAFLLRSTGSAASTPELGIYNNAGVRVSSGVGEVIAANTTTSRIVEVSVSPTTLVAGQIYWFAITDRTGNQMRVFNQIFANGDDYSCRRQAVNTLPTSTTFPLSDQDKGVWMAAY